MRTNAAQQVLRGTHRRHARRVLAGAREAPAGGCSSSGRGSDGKCTLLINRSVVTSPSSLRTSTSAQIAQTAERQLCSRRRLTGDADAAARTAPVGRDGMCTPASRLGPQGGSGRGEQAKVTFGPVLSAWSSPRVTQVLTILRIPLHRHPRGLTGAPKVPQLGSVSGWTGQAAQGSRLDDPQPSGPRTWPCAGAGAHHDGTTAGAASSCAPPGCGQALPSGSHRKQLQRQRLIAACHTQGAA